MIEPAVRQREIAAEQEFVDEAYRRLDVVRQDARAVHADGMARGRYRHRAGLVERDAMTHHATRRLRQLESEYEGLVFGRLDFTDGAVRRIGRLGLRDEELSTILVDWRAPAAAPFYQATAEEPLDVVRRRVIRCTGPLVEDVDDELLARTPPDGLPVIGEGALLVALTRARGTAMRDIVATIQREQDVAIRAPASGIVEIEGGPGTGKTAVALHRAAYLLYIDRERYTSAGVLLVGPSEVFVSYISHVLPSLGEDTVALRTVGQLLDGVSAARRDPPEVAAIKGSSRMCELLRRLVRQPPPEVPTEFRVVYRGDVLRLDAGELDAARRIAMAADEQPNATRFHAAEALIDALHARACRYAEDHNRPDRGRMFDDMQERDEFRRFLLTWWPFSSPGTVLRRLGDARFTTRVADGLLTPAEVSLLSNSYARMPDERPAPDGPDTRWSVADVALIDELRELLGEPPRKRKPPAPHPDDPQELSTWADRVARPEVVRPPNYADYGLVVVDEAQDLSPMQWRMLGRRGRRANWTIVGDPAQSSWPDETEAACARDEALGTRKPRRAFHLPINYRNSAEIFELAARAAGSLPHADRLPRAVRSTGVVPTLRKVAADELPAATRQAAVELRDGVDGTVCVIGAMAMVPAISGWLDAVAEGITVLGSLDAKGLEFDGVLVVEPGALVAEASTGRRGLYVALSRATHRLTVLDTDRSWLETAAGVSSPTPRQGRPG